MGKIKDLGRRLELLPLDKHCQDISIGLYQQVVDGVPRFLIHTYSSAKGTPQRVEYLTRALIVVLGLESVSGSEPWVQFPCRRIHKRALRRAFLDLCKLDTGSPLNPKPLTVFDKKANCDLTAVSVGEGIYRFDADPTAEAGPRRAAAVAKGFAKICEMDFDEGKPDQVAFACKTSHDALIGMLMFRAQNVRAAMREQELAATRGVLSAPGQQE